MTDIDDEVIALNKLASDLDTAPGDWGDTTAWLREFAASYRKRVQYFDLQKDRLQRALHDVEASVDDLNDALGEIGPDEEPEQSDGVVELLVEIVHWHDESHSGPFRYCSHLVCKAADQIPIR
jgi:hypothetical protein